MAKIPVAWGRQVGYCSATFASAEADDPIV